MTELETLKQEHDKLFLAYQSSLQENENLKKRVVQFESAYQLLNHQLQELRRNRFGKKSERYIDPANPQLSLYEDEQPSPPPVDAHTVDVPAHKRKKNAKKNTADLPREIRIIPVQPEEMTCHCGCQKAVINYATKELFHHQPAVFCVVEERREIVACSKGCEQSIVTAPAPKHILPKTKATEELLAATIVNKLHHRQPLYHLEKYTEMAGISRETMARWHIKLVMPLQPLFNLMKDEVITYDIASIDATTLQVLKEPGRAAETKSYVYCIRGGPPDKKVILYAYNALEHKKFVDTWLEGFAGSIHMDADPFFDTLLNDSNVSAANCNAHARRPFESIVKQTKGKKGLAYEAIGFFNALYKIEKQAKRNKLSPELRHQVRKQKSKPILADFKQWLETNYPHVLPQSPLGKAFTYCLNHWDGLTLFLTDGRLEIDNNHTEQEIKPLVIARKNFMFANSINGAHALCMHFSLIRTARLHKLNPYTYLVAVFKKIPHCESLEDYEQLLPWNIQL